MVLNSKSGVPARERRARKLPRERIRRGELNETSKNSPPAPLRPLLPKPRKSPLPIPFVDSQENALDVRLRVVLRVRESKFADSRRAEDDEKNVDEGVLPSEGVVGGSRKDGDGGFVDPAQRTRAVKEGRVERVRRRTRSL